MKKHKNRKAYGYTGEIRTLKKDLKRFGFEPGKLEQCMENCNCSTVYFSCNDILFDWFADFCEIVFPNQISLYYYVPDEDKWHTL